jgi:hypothetical protein
MKGQVVSMLPQPDNRMPTDVVKTVHEGGDRAGATQRWYLLAFLVDAGWAIQNCVTVPVLVMKAEASEFRS